MALRRTNKLCTRCQGAVAEHFINESGDYLCDHCDAWRKLDTYNFKDAVATTHNLFPAGHQFHEALEDLLEDLIQLEAAENSK